MGARSNGFTRSVFWSGNKGIMFTPVYYIKVGCNGVYIAWTCFRDACRVTSTPANKHRLIHIIKHGDSNSDVLICVDTKFNLSVS